MTLTFQRLRFERVKNDWVAPARPAWNVWGASLLLDLAEALGFCVKILLHTVFRKRRLNGKGFAREAK